ncbi:MAG: hypothetical protein CM15mP49_34400 [Actinomycetota bacterium]|nr:MAG: hypothetical protein CM15mP49_34400 [Actinomycetota bacterium]
MSPILKSQEITFGLDLAHAVGNVPLDYTTGELILLHGAPTSTSTLDRQHCRLLRKSQTPHR